VTEAQDQPDRPRAKKGIASGSYPALAGPPGVMLPTAAASVGGLDWLGPIHMGVRPRWFGRPTLALAGLLLIALFFVPVMARAPDGDKEAAAALLFRWGLPFEGEYSGWIWAIAFAPLFAGALLGSAACLSHRLRGPVAAAAGLVGLLLLMVPHAVLRARRLGIDPKAALLVATTGILLLLIVSLAALVAAHGVARRRKTPATRRWPAIAAAVCLFLALVLAVLLLGEVRLAETLIAPETLRLQTPLPDADLVTRSCLVFGSAAFAASAVLALVKLLPAAAAHRLNRTGHYCGRAGTLLIVLGYLFYFHSVRPSPEAGVTIADRLSGAGLFVHLVLPHILCAAVLAEGLGITAILAGHEPQAERPDAEPAADATAEPASDRSVDA
jgi:hypothetical protein